MQRHKRATVDETVMGSIRTRDNEIFNIFIFSLCTRVLRQWAKLSSSLNTQWLKNSAKIGERRCLKGKRRVLTPGSQAPFAHPAMWRKQGEIKKISLNENQTQNYHVYNLIFPKYRVLTIARKNKIIILRSINFRRDLLSCI